MKLKVLVSCVRLFAAPWTIARQASLSMGFSRQEYWSGYPFLSSRAFPHSGIKPRSPALQADSLPSESESEVAQSCLTLFDPIDSNLPGSAVHGILQARILEWGAISFSRGIFRPRDQTQVSLIAGRRFNLWATREACLNHFRKKVLPLIPA